jgi:hypothetical protein
MSGSNGKSPEVWRQRPRNQFSKKLIEDLTTIWEVEGPGCLKIMAKEHPDRFALLAYSTLPKNVMLSLEQHAPGGLSIEDWALLVRVLDIIKAAQIDAGPGEVFAVIETALRGHYAKQIENRS